MLYILILVAVLISGRADAVPERTRRDEEQLPPSDQVKAYPVTSLNLHTEAQLSAATGEGSIDKVLNLKAPNGFSYDDSNEAGESFETEANVVTGYDGKDQVNALDVHNFVPPSRGIDYNNEFMTTTHASASADFETGDKTKNRAVVKNDASNQSKLQAQFRQEDQYGAESQADTVIQENQETFKNLPPAQEMMQLPYGTSPLVRPSVNSGDIKNTLKANPILAYTGPVDKYTPFYQVSDTGIKKNKPMANGYEVSRNPNWIPYQKGNPTKSLVTNDVPYTKNNNWNPYTKPAEGETLVQAAEEIQSRAESVTNLAAQENGNRSPNLNPYQNKNLNKPLMPIGAFQNSYNNNKNWNPYTKPTEGETLVQAEGNIQENGDQSPTLIQYQKENPNIPLVPINVIQNDYNSNKNWNPYTEPTERENLVQVEQEIQSNGKAEANKAAQENGNRSPNLNPYQNKNLNKPLVPIGAFQNGYNNNENWNPYTKPVEGETLVQAEGNIQENGDRSSKLIQYQKENPDKPLVPINVFQNDYNSNKNWDPYTEPTEGENLVQVEQEIQSNGKADANIAAQENGNRSPNLNPYQNKNLNKPLVPIGAFQNGYNNNENWNPYTKPAEGETLVQAEGNIQENGDRSPKFIQYQKENPNIPLVPINVIQNDHNSNKNWNPYTEPTESENLVQVEQEIQSNGKAEANIAAQENGNRSPNLNPYQNKNLNKPLMPIGAFQNGYNNNENWNPYTKPAEGETLVQAEGNIQENGDRSPKLIQYQKENPNIPLAPINVIQNDYNSNKNWNPYMEPTEGENLVQVEQEIQSNGKAEANIAAQENGNRSPNLNPYQNKNLNKPLVPIGAFQNGYNNNENWNPYTKPAEGETLVQGEGEIQSSQLNSGIQYKPSTQANIVAQSNDGFYYSEENKITSAAEVAAEAPTNIASLYSGGLATTQMSKGMKTGAQGSGSSIYGNTNNYNNVYSYGPGNANSHLQNGAQFGAVIDVEPPSQGGPVVEARFGQTTHPAHRPLSAFGYKQPNGWNHW